MTMEENTRKVYNSGRLSVISDVDFLQGNASGSVVSISDGSPIEHKLKVKLTSKNLFDESKLVDLGFTLQEDGRYYDFSNKSYVLWENTEGIVGSLNIRANIEYLDSKGFELRTVYTDDTYMWGVGITNKSKTVREVGLSNSAVRETWISNVLISTDLSLTASDYTPYIDDFSSVRVSRYGKNLLPYPHRHTTQTVNGITFTDNGDGTVTANGTATADAYYQFVKMNDAWHLPKGEYTISGCPSGGNYSLTYCISGMINNNGITSAFAAHDTSQNPKINITDDNATWRCMIVIRSGVKVENLVFKPQLELGSTATEYEPYIEPQTVTANSDGTVEGLTSLSPNMALMSDTDGVNVDCSYYRDIDTYIDNLITDVVLTGGE